VRVMLFGLALIVLGVLLRRPRSRRP
jgi:hypothetical protein